MKYSTGIFYLDYSAINKNVIQGDNTYAKIRFTENIERKKSRIDC